MAFRCVSAVKRRVTILSLHLMVVTRDQKRNGLCYTPGKITPPVVYKLKLGSLKAEAKDLY